jgi:hypothetical protein
MIDSARQQFVLSNIAYLTRLASFQRAGIYSESASWADRRAVGDSLCDELVRLAGAYRERPWGDEEHVATIVGLAGAMSEWHGAALANGRFRIGIAQKALNLYLKYWWCFGLMDTPPPHCPFDRTVIQRLPGCSDIVWTKFDSKDEYRRLVDAARVAAGERSIAEWELVVFNGG